MIIPLQSLWFLVSALPLTVVVRAARGCQPHFGHDAEAMKSRSLDPAPCGRSARDDRQRKRRLSRAEFEALDFAGGGFGELGDEFDVLGHFVAGEALAERGAEFIGYRGGAGRKSRSLSHPFCRTDGVGMTGVG